MMNIVLLDSGTLGADVDLSPIRQAGNATEYHTTAPEQIAERIRDAEVVITNKMKLGASNLSEAKRLRLICVTATGYDNVDTAYCASRGIALCNVPGYSTESVAQLTLAMALSLANHLEDYRTFVRDGSYTASGMANHLIPPYHELSSLTWGVVGGGAIGGRVARLADAFGAHVLMCRRTPDEQYEQVAIDELCRRADIISLHVPLTDETRGMISRRLFEMMKPGAILVNCARAGIINEEDLRAVKASKKIVYCNDVYPKDAAGPKSVADVADIMLPHLGANTYEANFCAAKRAAEQTIAYFEQGVTNCVVNKALPDGLDAGYQKLAYALTALTRAYLGDTNNPTRIETSFYGNLANYAKWLMPPVVAAIAKDFAVEQGPKDAEQFLTEAGVELVNRMVDNSKNYGESMTIDLFVGNGDTIVKAGARGTIAENTVMISRLDNFDKLYFDPAGHHLFVEYADEPGVIGRIAGILGEKNINIIDLRAPQNVKLGRSLSVITTNVEVPEMLIDRIREAVNATKAFGFNYMP